MTTTLAGIRFEALGTQVEVFSESAESLAPQLRSHAAEYEARFSRFRASSELQQLCRPPAIPAGPREAPRSSSR